MKRWRSRSASLSAVVHRLRRRRPIELIWQLVHGWQRHRTGRHVTLIAYFSFVSVFPLLLVFASVTAIITDVLDWDLERISTSVVGEIPLVGDQIAAQAGSTTGSIAAVVAGGLVALWAATKAFMKIFDLNDDVWEVPAQDREGFARRRARCLMGLAVVGFRALAATAITGVVTVIGLPVVGLAFGAVLAIAMNVTVLAGFLRLGSRRVGWRVLAPGAVAGGVAFWVLQLFGSNFVAWSSGAQQGPFAPTFALMAWLTLHAVVITVAAELNLALSRVAQPSSEPTGDLPDIASH
jgi:membrane protein